MARLNSRVSEARVNEGARQRTRPRNSATSQYASDDEDAEIHVGGSVDDVDGGRVEHLGSDLPEAASRSTFLFILLERLALTFLFCHNLHAMRIVSLSPYSHTDVDLQ